MKRLDKSRSEWHEMLSAPLFTSSVLDYINSQLNSGKKNFELCLQLEEESKIEVSPFVSFGGLGRLVSQLTPASPIPIKNIVYMNTNTPSTTMICGVQGAGKSHSVSVIIENSLIRSPELGRLPHPLSVVVFHLGAVQGGMHLPCESAFLRRSNSLNRNYKIPVIVLVSTSNLKAMRRVYAETGATVIPFYLSTADLNCTRMFSLMHVTEDGKIPLYIQVVHQILRSMGNEKFSYKKFKEALAQKSCEFTAQQQAPLNLRIQLLESILLECQKEMGGASGSVKQHFKPGVITIVDLTDPFLNAASASALFDIALSLYLETEIRTGKLLVLDEAHKVYPKMSRLTGSISQMIRRPHLWNQYSQ